MTDTDADQAVEPEQEPAPPLTPLDMPVDGVPPVVESERALMDAARAIAAGEGPVAHPGLLGEPIAPRFPSAATLAGLAASRLAAGGGLLPPEPLYLRRPDAREPGPPKSVLAASGRASRAG